MWRPRLNRDYGLYVLGSADESPRVRRIRIQTLLTVSVLVANIFGAVVAAVLVSVGIPDPSVFQPGMWWVTGIVVPVYVVLAVIVGTLVGTVMVTRDLRWSIRQREPTYADARRARRAPRRLAGVQVVLWLGGLILLTVCFGVLDPDLIPKMVFVIGLSGAVVVAITFLLTRIVLRPVAAEVLSAGFGRTGRRRGGVRQSTLLAWFIGSAIPFVGILLVAVFGVFRDETSKLDMFIAVTVLSVVGLVVGLFVTVLTSASITGPVRSVSSGMARVRAGDLDVDLVVYDDTELGELQVGFNSMVEGLRERERVRDIFGRHVGHGVAEAALATDPELGGTEETVAVVFVDVIGSTRLATERTPTEVVAILNRFFTVIVTEVERNRGLVNKFEGDAVLAIFGAPIELHDPAGAALRTARRIGDRLADEVPELQAGIGVSHGTVVAGNVGAIQRFEYTVIGDPVNESARLSEEAKREPRRAFAAERAVLAAGEDEARHWERADEVVLRGRGRPTVVYLDRPSASPTEQVEPSTIRA